VEKTIEIDVVNKYDLVEKYDEDKISRNLIDYILQQAILAKKYERINITINKKSDIDKDCIKLIKEGLKDEYNRSQWQRKTNNNKQLWMTGLGIFLLFLSFLVKEKGVWKEILLISGWVPIWESIEMQLFPDVEGAQKRRLIKKILNGQMKEKIIEEKRNRKRE